MMEGAELPESMRGYHVQTATSSDGGGASAQTLEVVGRLERDRPVPVPSEVRVTGGYVALVRVLIAGICNTDIEIMRGYMGFNGILGHEFVGYVVGVAPLQKPTAKADANARSWIGKRVVGDINCACTSCGICVRAKGEDARCTLARGDGEPRHFLNEVQAMARNHCPKRRVLGILSKDGTYADWLCLPLENLHEIPEEISSVNAAFVEPLAAAYRIVEQGVLLTEASSVGGVDTRVAVLGDGKLGLLIAEVVGRHLNADSAGPPRVDIIGRHMEKMRLLSKEANVRTLLEGDVRARHEEFFKSYDVVIDATGHQSGLVLSTDLVRCLGKYPHHGMYSLVSARTSARTYTRMAISLSLSLAEQLIFRFVAAASLVYVIRGCNIQRNRVFEIHLRR